MKAWYKSKTVWFNLITLVIGVLGAVIPVVPPGIWAILLTAFFALGNGMLRIWFTDMGIASANARMTAQTVASAPPNPTQGQIG